MLPQDTRKSLAQLEAEHKAAMKDAQKLKKPIFVVEEGFVVLEKPEIPAEEPKVRPFFFVEVKIPN